MSTIQYQSDHQHERVYDTTLDRVRDNPSIERVEPTVRGDLDGVMGLFDPPDEESGDDDVGHERDGEQGRGDVLDA